MVSEFSHEYPEKRRDLKSEGMLLKINRNTKTAKGYYYIAVILLINVEVRTVVRKDIQLKW